MDLKTYDKMLKDAQKARQEDDQKLEPLRQAHGEAQQKLEAVTSEKAQLEALVAEFEGNMNSEVTADQFQEALDRLRVLDVLVRRAEAEAKKVSAQWQQEQRAVSNRARSRLFAFRNAFDTEAANVRKDYDLKFQRLL